MKSVFIVIRTEGMYESTDHPVRAFDHEQAAKAFAEECTATFKRQHELFVANRDRHGEAWWGFDVKKTDAIEARYERKLPDRGCGIRNSDVAWGVWEVPFSSGERLP
jgi:hypothetical protein